MTPARTTNIANGSKTNVGRTEVEEAGRLTGDEIVEVALVERLVVVRG